jgi:hypothetical protein
MNRDDMMIKMVAKTLTRRVLHCCWLQCCIAGSGAVHCIASPGSRHPPAVPALSLPCSAAFIAWCCTSLPHLPACLACLPARPPLACCLLPPGRLQGRHLAARPGVHPIHLQGRVHAHPGAAGAGKCCAAAGQLAGRRHLGTGPAAAGRCGSWAGVASAGLAGGGSRVGVSLLGHTSSHLTL